MENIDAKCLFLWFQGGANTQANKLPSVLLRGPIMSANHLTRQASSYLVYQTWKTLLHL
jgi:hypothetical protein